jgi:hypothetical protein
MPSLPSWEKKYDRHGVRVWNTLLEPGEWGSSKYAAMKATAVVQVSGC